VLTDIKDGEYASGTMKYFCAVPETKATGELIGKCLEDNALLIVTDEHFLYVTIEKEGKNNGKANILFKTTL
jgi:hypothetical protein